MNSPFQRLTVSSEKTTLKVLLIAVIVFIGVMRFLDTNLKNELNKSGIVGLELAKDLSRAELIINSWDTHAKIAAGMSMGFDFLFLITYALFIGLLIHRLNKVAWENSKIYSLGVLLVWGTFLAAFFDVIENVALIKLLLGDLNQQWSTTAYYFAVAKFSLLLLSLVFILISALKLLLFRRK